MLLPCCPDRLGQNGGGQGIKAALSAFKAADTTQVVRAFFRLYVVFTEIMALETFGALVGIEPYEESGDAIEQRKYGTEGTQDSAPGSSRKENSDKKQDKDC
jgi:hypothetical protein